MAADRVPAGLSAPGRALWKAVSGEYVLSPGELAVLEQAARTSDELARLADTLAAEPVLVTGSMGQTKVNPLFAAVTAHRRTFDSLVTSLGLPMPEEATGRPRSATARRAARTRWERSGRRGLRAVGDGSSSA